jgi:hypothetical protein
MKKSFTPIVLVLCISFFLLSHQFWIKADAQKPFNVTTKGLYKLPKTEILKLSSLGYSITIADYLWINLILKIGQSNVLEEYEEHVLTENPHGMDDHHENHFITKPTQKDSLIDDYLTYHLPDIFYNYIDRITDLDPNFLYPYLIGFTFALQPEYHNPQGFKLLLKKGLERHSDYWEMDFFYAYYLFTFENAEDSLVLRYLRDSLNAPKSIRVFNKELAYNTFVAFSQKMNADIRKHVFLEGMVETLDNEQLKQTIKNKIKQKVNND